MGSGRGKRTSKCRVEGKTSVVGIQRAETDRSGELSLERVHKATSGQTLLDWLRKKSNANVLGARTI